MEEYQKIYESIRDYQKSVHGDSLHDTLLRGFLDDPQKVEEYRDKSTVCLWDTEWIEAFEAAIPFIEKAIDEQRRFIESFSEIRRVDQARKITVDSIRYLAEHSNMISRVQGGDIIPDKVLIVQREDNYAIYENRFLYTLVRQMEDFLHQRVDTVRELNGLHSLYINFERNARAGRVRMSAKLSCTLEHLPAASLLPEEDAEEELTETERVDRLDRRTRMLSSTSLIRMLKGCTPVVSPIVRTNVFKNNENFKQALNLFEFLQRYQKPGYEIISSPETFSPFPQELREALCEALTAETVSLRLAQDPDLDSGLRESYQITQSRRQLDLQQADNIQQRALHSQIAQARREEIAVRQVEINRREEIISNQNQTISSQQTEIESQQQELTTCRQLLDQTNKELVQLRRTLEETRASMQRELAEAQRSLETSEQLRKADQIQLDTARSENLHLENALTETRTELQATRSRVEEERRMHRDTLEQAKAEVLEARKQMKDTNAEKNAAEQSARESQREIRSLKEKNASLQKQMIQAHQTIRKLKEKNARRAEKKGLENTD